MSPVPAEPSLSVPVAGEAPGVQGVPHILTADEVGATARTNCGGAKGVMCTRLEDLPPVLTVEELAALLRTNRKTVYEHLARGEIPGVRRIGRTIRISRDAVLRWLAEGQGRVSRRRGDG